MVEEKPVGPTTATLYIEGFTYSFPESDNMITYEVGMTWQEWIESDYSPAYFTMANVYPGGSVNYGGTFTLKWKGPGYPQLTDEIDPSKSYYWED